MKSVKKRGKIQFFLVKEAWKRRKMMKQIVSIFLIDLGKMEVCSNSLDLCFKIGKMVQIRKLLVFLQKMHFLTIIWFSIYNKMMLFFLLSSIYSVCPICLTYNPSNILKPGVTEKCEWMSVKAVTNFVKSVCALWWGDGHQRIVIKTFIKEKVLLNSKVATKTPQWLRNSFSLKC